MRLAILGDTHFSARSDSKYFHSIFAKFYNDTFFPTLKARGVNHIIQTGDLFDRRKYMNFLSLTLSREYFFDNLVENNITMTTYIGNHDSFFTNTLKVNSPNLLLSDYSDYVSIVQKPTTLIFEGLEIDFFPWICDANEQASVDLIKSSKSQIAFGHFELTGFEMDAGVPCVAGMDREMLKKYDMVISGHFHHRSSDGHIFYVGSPYQFTWADYEDVRGFHIFDTDTRSLDFIPNPHVMFYKIEYDDTNETIDSIDAKDYAEYHGKYVKVVVKKKNSNMLFDRFMNNFYEQGQPADLGVVQDFTDYTVTTMEENVDQSEQTHVLLEKYVDGVDMTLDKTKMKTIMRDIYIKAQNDQV